MKKLILKATLVLFLTTTLLSCNSDDDSGPNYQEENFFDTFLTTTGFNQKEIIFLNSGTYESGLEFTPLVNGSITSLKFKSPAINPSTRITIWDKSTGAVIKTEIVNVAIANHLYEIDIVDIPLVKDKVYALSFNSDDWYERSQTDGSAITYPISVGNIKVLTYIWKSGTTQVYPTNVSSTYIAGDLSFNFLQQ